MKRWGRTFGETRIGSAKALIQVCSPHRMKIVTAVNEKAASDRS